MSEQRQQRIEAILERLRHFGENPRHCDFFVTRIDDDFQCQFCHERGRLQTDIQHHNVCAITLAKRTSHTTDFFDDLATKEILHQLASVEEWPLKHVDLAQYRPYCPFCEAFMTDGRGIHEMDCAILFAKQSEHR